MAVGDIIADFSALGTALTFQPAAGIEVCVQNAITGSQNKLMQSTDGALFSEYHLLSTHAGHQTSSTADPCNMKLYATNSQYIFQDLTAGSYVGYGGIQTV